MNTYVESSAVLAWLLNEPDSPAVLRHLSNVTYVFTSALTSIECARALHRAATMKRISRTEELALLRMLDEAVGAWNVHEITHHVLALARSPYAVEPVRTLDAIHLATIQAISEAPLELNVLSLDHRVRQNAEALGFSVVPRTTSTPS